MKAEEIRKLSVEKIEEQLDDAREKLMRMRFQIATGELKDQNLPRLTRRDIARMETILRDKRAEAAPAKTEGEA
jgi:large subunit ribosomal protein L29